jgi:hypothetical protein
VLKSSKIESYPGPCSNTGDKHKVPCGKVAEITPPNPDQVQWGMHIEDLLWDIVGRIFHGASWMSIPFEVLSCLPNHFIPIPLIGLRLSYLAHCGPPHCRLYPPSNCS